MPLFGGDVEKVLGIVVLLCPGFLISFFRNVFVTGRRRSFLEASFDFLIISSAYYASVGLVFFSFDLLSPIFLFLLLFVLPSLIGLAVGVLYQKGFFNWIFNILKINPVHPAETAWDFVFGRRQSPCWIVVTLNDGRKIRGWYCHESGVSSNLSHRDIYISDVRKLDFSKFEGDGRTRGMWIHESEVKFIEFIPD